MTELTEKGLTVKKPRDSYFTLDKSISEDKDVADQIAKAFTTGTGITPATQPDGAAYRLESLDPTLNISTFGEADYTIYNDIFRQRVRTTVQKYTVYYSHGRSGHHMFQNEIAQLVSNEPKAKQQTVNVKFLVDTKGMSFATNMVNNTVEPDTLLEISGMNDLAKGIEYATFYGDSDLASQKGEGLEFDGLSKLIYEHNHLNANGNSLTPALINKAATQIGLGFGVATDAYMPIGVKGDFINQFLPAQRILMPSPQSGAMQVGFDIAKFISVRGNISLHGSTIMDLDNILDLDAVPEANAPMAPTVTAKVVTGANGVFRADNTVDDKGHVLLNKEVGQELEYRVVAVGTADSLPTDAIKATPANATDGVQLTITANHLLAKVPDYVAIYRKSQVPDDDRFFLLDRIPWSDFDGTTYSYEYTDLGVNIPGTADVFIGELKPETIKLLELAPIMKFPLAITTTSTNFAMLWYGALQLTFPKRWVQIHNVLYNSKYDDMKFA